MCGMEYKDNYQMDTNKEDYKTRMKLMKVII